MKTLNRFLAAITVLAVVAMPSISKLTAGALAASAPSEAPSPAWQLLTYRGLTFHVPTAWPIHDLATEPSTCVRYDVHAVYLGTESPNADCPAHAVGHTEAVYVRPFTLQEREIHAADTWAQAMVNGEAVEVANGPDTDFERDIVFGRTQLLVTLTAVGQSDPVAGEVLASFHTVPSAPRKPVPVPGLPSSRQPTGPRPRTVYTGVGFDACSAPSTGSMSAWLGSPYRSVGVYIGGANRACNQPNLTAGWVSSVEGQGWGLVLTYVGLQAPSNTCGCAAINPSQAGSQGTAAADDAVSEAQALGIGGGNPIYNDMEAYKSSSDNATVAAYLSGWSAEIRARGYLAGVYGSLNSTISDLVQNLGGSGFNVPDDIWFAIWDGR